MTEGAIVQEATVQGGGQLSATRFDDGLCVTHKILL